MKSSPRVQQLAAALAVAAALVLPACSSNGSSGPGKNEFVFSSATKLGSVIKAADRKKADDFTGTLIDGGKTKLSDDAGKVVVVNFFGSWCGPCKAETPGLQALYTQVKSKGVQLVGIDIKDDRDNATSFLKQVGVTYPVIYDFPGKTIIKLGNPPGSPPFSYLIDKSGKVAAVYLGALSAKDLEPVIDKLLAEQ
ncbi:MAG: TlpA family protein disulfide reductase [Jatrophihabitans sp.]